jgi:LysM repeat protein
MKRNVLTVAFFMTIVILFGANLVNKEEKTVSTQYTIRPGDTLYSIAEDYGVKNWRKWVYETRQENNITDCGALRPGQVITIEVTQ